MNSITRKIRNNAEITVEQLYSFELGKLWRALKCENVSLWMLCFYFFWEYVRIQHQYSVIDILPWAQVSLILSILFAILDRDVGWVSNPLNGFMIAMAAIIVLSGVFAFQPELALNDWKEFGGWFILYFLVVSVVNTERRLLLFLLAYCLFNLKMAQHGALSWAGRGFSFADFGLIGAPGWFRNSGEFAIQMLIYGSLALSIAISLHSYWGKYRKIILVGCAVMGYMAVMGASSRGAQIALAGIAVWWLLKSRIGIRALLLLTVLTVIAMYLLPDEQVQRFTEIGEDKSSLQRIAYWTYALEEVIPRFPVLGLGYHNWFQYVNFMVPEGMGPYETVEVQHNILIQMVTETGFVGLTCYLLMTMCAFVLNVRTRRMAKELENKLHANIAYGLDAGLIGYLIAGQFVTVLWYPFTWVQFAIIAALYSITRRSHEEKFGDGRGRRQRRFAQQPAMTDDG